MSSAVTLHNPFLYAPALENSQQTSKINSDSSELKSSSQTKVSYKEVSGNVHINDPVVFDIDNSASQKPVTVKFEINYEEGSKKKPEVYPKTVAIEYDIPAASTDSINLITHVQNALKNRGIDGNTKVHIKVTTQYVGERATQTTEMNVKLKRYDEFAWIDKHIKLLPQSPKLYRTSLWRPRSSDDAQLDFAKKRVNNAQAAYDVAKAAYDYMPKTKEKGKYLDSYQIEARDKARRNMEIADLNLLAAQRNLRKVEEGLEKAGKKKAQKEAMDEIIAKMRDDR